MMGHFYTYTKYNITSLLKYLQVKTALFLWCNQARVSLAIVFSTKILKIIPKCMVEIKIKNSCYCSIRLLLLPEVPDIPFSNYEVYPQ